MRQFLIVIGSLMAAGAAVGWLMAGAGGRDLSDQQSAWTDPSAPPTTADGGAGHYARLMATDHFGEQIASEAGAQGGAEGGAGSEDAAAPKIAAATLKDGEIAISAYGADGSMVTVGVGETLPGGWKVLSASLDRVVVSLNDRDLEIVVFPHEDNGS
ncbi:MAG: hypothetical protein AAGD92_01835 [Pseudomonadota bacterium]